MKKVAITGKRSAALVDAVEPKPVADWAVVKVHAAPMCAEYKGFAAGHENAFLGHEAAGEVAAVTAACPVKVGQRVVVMPQYPCGRCELCLAGDYIHCEHCYDVCKFTGCPEGTATMAQYVIKPAWLLMPIPDGVSYELASLACCGLGPSFGALEAMNVNSFDSILITGAGPVGLGAIVNASFRGAKVFAVESAPWRVEHAKKLGASRIFNPADKDIVKQIKDASGGGVSCALDCSGNVQAQRLCLDTTKRKGPVAFVGECGADLAVRVSPDLIRTGRTILGCWHYNLSLYPKVMQVIQNSPVIKNLISHVIPMSEIQRALETSASLQNAKIILKPWE